MSTESRVPTIEIKEEARQSLKNFARHAIGNLPEARAAVLLKDIRVLENFLFGTKGKKEIHHSDGESPSVYHNAHIKEYHKKNYIKRLTRAGDESDAVVNQYVDGLQSVVGGMINMMPLERVKEIEANPIEFISLLTGVSFTTYGKEAEEKNFSIDQIAKDQWINFPWGLSSIARTVQEIFRKAGRNVKVEFLRPNSSQAHDCIVVSKNISGKENGIAIPAHGTKLDVAMDFDLFGSKLGGNKKVSSLNLVTFPEVERRSGEWKVITHGKLKK